jgi:hypothetical protein
VLDTAVLLFWPALLVGCLLACFAGAVWLVLLLAERRR